MTIGFVETLVEVNETDGTAALNVSIRSPSSDVALGFEIILLVNSMDGSAVVLSYIYLTVMYRSHGNPCR